MQYKIGYLCPSLVLMYYRIITLVITVHVSKTAVHLEIDDRHLFKFGFYEWSGYWAPVMYLGGKKLAFKVNPKFLCF